MNDFDPKPGQTCETCGEDGHLVCFPERSGPDIEHLFVALNDAAVVVERAS